MSQDQWPTLTPPSSYATDRWPAVLAIRIGTVVAAAPSWLSEPRVQIPTRLSSHVDLHV